MPGDAELFAIKDRAADRLMRMPGVTGVGIGGRRRDGRPTGELVIKVYVKEKLSAHELPEEQLIPAEFEGIATDVEIMQQMRLLGGPPEPEPEDPDLASGLPTGKPLVPVAGLDLRWQRPLVGGCAIQNEMTGAMVGTLGCILTHLTDATKVYALTNYHIAGLAGIGGVAATVGTTRVGQSRWIDSEFLCWLSAIGRYAGGGVDSDRDAGLVQLFPGLKWKAVILEIGPVAGIDTVTVEDARSGTYKVRKRGPRTGLTGGTVDSVGTRFTTELGTVENTIITIPDPDPTVAAGTTVYFTQQFDSGSALVNADNKIVGLHFAGSTDPSPRSGAIPIGVVLAKFAEVEHLPLAVATATDINTVHTVPGPATPTLAPLGAELPRRLEADLDSFPAGRALLDLWRSHGNELTDLVRHDRQVMVAWHRNGGPRLSQTLVRMADEPALSLPSTVDDRPLAICFERIGTALARHGSPALGADLARVRDVLPDLDRLAGLTYPRLLTVLSGSPKRQVPDAQ